MARRVQISPKLIERWGAEWRARGEASFPGTGRRAGPKLPPEERTVADLERKIGQLTPLTYAAASIALKYFQLHPGVEQPIIVRT